MEETEGAEGIHDLQKLFLEAATPSKRQASYEKAVGDPRFHFPHRNPPDPSLTHGQMDWVMDSTAKPPSKSSETKGQTRKAKASQHGGRTVTL